MRIEDMKTFSPNGPGRMYCKVCGWVGSTNALARASHLKSNRHHEALKLVNAQRAPRRP